jgi:hypothetical protein
VKVAGLCAVGLGLFRCEPEPVDERPERVVAEFVERMQRVHGDPESARAAYDLLWGEGKANLAERAKRASALSDRKVGPEEMLAPSHFSLAFTPRRWTARIDGQWAVVTVAGEADQQREIRCVAEDGRWRIVQPFPPLTPIRKRADSAE